MLKYITIFTVLVFIVFWAYTAYTSKPLFKDYRSELMPLQGIADRSEALTFARTKNSLLLVTGLDREVVQAIDLSAVYGAEVTSDPIGLFQKAGYDSLRLLTGPERAVSLEELKLPLDFGSAHLAAGTNYKEHSEEVLLNDPPFLFPKNTEPTSWNARVPYTKRLDFEAELAMVPLEQIQKPDQTPRYGLILSNDFTDRWTLIKGLKLKQPMGTTGFAAAKGRERYLPVGCFLVIPKDRDFYKKIELRLFVNDRLRQRFTADEMIIKYEEIIQQAFNDLERDYRKGKEAVDLIPKGGIERGSLILTGTAGGVIFKPANIWWQGYYLKAGDVIRTEADYLGHLHNEVERLEE